MRRPSSDWKAADQGLASAQTNLGTRYASGRGVPMDAAQAVEWFRKAAEQGDTSAAFNLA
jgi:TPR repeat protein